MIPFERIMCPVDLSRRSDEGLRYAVALARAYGAKLFVCYCGKASERVADLVQVMKDEDVTGLIEELVTMYAGAGSLSPLDWEGIFIECDDAAEAISREAAGRGVDLIVMCSRRRPHAAALLGSTAETVCRTAPCPVLVIHPGEREWVAEAAGEIRLGRVLVAYDFSEHSELALRYGLSLAQEYQAELHLLHVLPEPGTVGPEVAPVGAGPGGPSYTTTQLEKAVPAEARLWCRVSPAVRRGSPHQEVLSYAEAHGVDLICIGAHGAGASGLFGTNTDHVLRRASCPVLIARRSRAARTE